ncbi:MAG: metal-dependent hydrolase [Porticoccaceae bacterium]
MDPIAHTLTGGALAATGLRRATPLATAALLIGANIADVDIVVAFASDYMALAHRRGWTHGVLALVLLPPLLAAGLLLWDKLVRRRWRPGAEPARWWPLLLVSAIAVISHPALDWLNNYGLRWLMPFDGRWFYGDGLFIIDPWLWLIFGGLCFLLWSQRLPALLAWLLFWLPTSWLVLTNPLVPGVAQGLWLAGLVAVAVLRLRHVVPGEMAARTLVVVVTAYMAANVIANIPARAEVRSALAERGLGAAQDVMIGPVPANPLQGTVVAATEDAYYLGAWDWLATPHLTLYDWHIDRNLDDPAVVQAAQDISAQRYLSWSRFPYALIERGESEVVVRFEDARYADFPRGISGPEVVVKGSKVVEK